MEEMKHTTEASVLESKLGRQVEQFTSKWSKFRPVEISLKQVSPQLFLIWLARAGSPVPEYRRYLATLSSSEKKHYCVRGFPFR